MHEKRNKMHHQHTHPTRVTIEKATPLFRLWHKNILNERNKRKKASPFLKNKIKSFQLCYLLNAGEVELKSVVDPIENLVPTDKVRAIHYSNTRRHFQIQTHRKGTTKKNNNPCQREGCLFLNKRGEDSGGEISGEGFKFKTEFWFLFFLLYIFEKKIGNRRKGRGLNEWWRIENQWAKPNPTQPYQRREREEL